MRRLFPALLASLVLAACSSGGGESDSGSGVAGFNAGTTGLVLIATVTPDTFSSDAFTSDCTEPPDDVFEQRINTDFGDANIIIRDTSLVSTNQNKGVVFNTYTVSFSPVSPGAPALTTRSHGQSIPIFLGTASEASADTQVVLVELDTTKAEFRAKNPSGAVFTYNIVVTFRGSRIDTGAAVSVTARTTMEIGEFCNATL